MEMKKTGPVISALLFALVFGAQSHAQTPGQNTIGVEQPWARATPAGAKPGPVYGTLINNGSTGDRLLGATTPAGAHGHPHASKKHVRSIQRPDHTTSL